MWVGKTRSARNNNTLPANDTQHARSTFHQDKFNLDGLSLSPYPFMIIPYSFHTGYGIALTENNVNTWCA